MKHIDQIRFSVEYYINEAQNWPTSLCTVTCSIGGGRSQEMGGHWRPNAQPVGGAGRGHK